MAAFVLLQRTLFRAVGGHLNLSWMWSTAHLANAIALAVPFAGGGLAAAYSQRRFRQRGVEPVGATLVLTLAGIFSTVAFAAVMVLAAMASGSSAVASSGAVGAVIAIGIVTLVLGALRTPRGRHRLEQATERLLRVLQRAVRRPKGDPHVISRRTLERVNDLHLGLATVCMSFMWAFLNWIADAACLFFAIKATGVPVPWHQVLLVWAAGIGAKSFSPTPGGIGVVEPTMIAALVASGLRAPEAVAAVVLYRCSNAKIIATTVFAVGSVFRRREIPMT